MSVESINFEIYLASYPHLIYSYVYFLSALKDQVFACSQYEVEP